MSFIEKFISGRKLKKYIAGVKVYRMTALENIPAPIELVPHLVATQNWGRNIPVLTYLYWNEQEIDCYIAFEGIKLEGTDKYSIKMEIARLSASVLIELPDGTKMNISGSVAYLLKYITLTTVIK